MSKPALKPTTLPAHIQRRLASIAAAHLGIEILETRKSDRLDFHEVSLWSVRRALEAAFEAGVEHSRKASETTALANTNV
ncbi:DUF6900 domain-containing protein [Ralstonia pseudosolanacearum]|uniref:DUF6900 domain-containing protein n=1 Tax=Ralstonia pseudosolanacearum TaxID=1310165 RepID=UPI001FFB8E5B|nr:hypothetical protein [Ralstonia pseudosolanacearum]